MVFAPSTKLKHARSRRVTLAKAKKNATYVPSKTKTKRMGGTHSRQLHLTREQQELMQYHEQHPEQHAPPLALPTAPQQQLQQNPALVITSGEIGFDGRKFVFKPPAVPRQLALSDVRAAGFTSAVAASAGVETDPVERNVMRVVVGGAVV